MPNLLALAASFRSHSLNRRLLNIATSLAKDTGARINELDYTACETPLYREEPDGTPEYNWSIPGGLKNLIDWLSVDPRAPLAGKTALLMCASPSVRGGIVGLQQLRVPLEHLGMIVYPHAIGIGKAEIQFSDTRLMSDKEQNFLQTCVNDFVRITKAIHA